MPTQREFDALQQQVRVLSRELAIRPVRTPSRGGTAGKLIAKTIQLFGNTTIYTGPPIIEGCPRSTTARSSVPSQFPDLTTDYGAGLCAGKVLKSDGTFETDYVWVAICPIYPTSGGGPFIPPLDFTLPRLCFITSVSGETLKVTYSGGTTFVYQPLIA
jgi:hypothetical protein